MKRDDIKKLLVDYVQDEDAVKKIVDSIMTSNGQDIEHYKNENERLNGEIAEYKDNIDELTNKLNDTDDLDKANETLKSELESWQNKFETLVEKNKTEARERKIKEALTNANCNDVDFALYKIGKENFIFNNDDELIGFDDTIKEFKTNHSTFFNNQTGGGSPTPDPDKFKDNDLAEQKKFEDACKSLGW